MNIGNLKVNAEGVHVGRIATLAFGATVALRPFQSSNERAPRFDIVALSSDRRTWVKVGALWEYTSNDTGEAFLSGRIDDPSLASPIDVAMFRQDDDSYNVAWRRPKTRAQLPEAGSEGEGALPPVGTSQDDGTAATSSSAQTGGDGLGESTAPSPKGTKKTTAKAKETADA